MAAGRENDKGCLGREMTSQSVMHSEHRHELFLVKEGGVFRCNGCYEHGVGNHYKCTHPNSSCLFHLHIACAEGPRKLKITLPLYGDRYVFDFHAKPVNKDRYCVACGKQIRRYNYRCPQKDLDLHPSCTADFPVKLTVNNIPLKLNKLVKGRCHHCHRSKYRGRNLDTWAYVSKSPKKQYFAGCLLDCQIRNCREALARHGSAGGSQVSRTSSLGSMNGSTTSSQVSRTSSFSSRNGSISSSQISRTSSFSSQNGSTGGSQISRDQTPGLHQILGYIAPVANNITQGFTFITGWPFVPS